MSAGGVIASILVVACLFWVGLVDEVGFQTKGTTLNLSTLPVAIGLYGYCYSGHAIFPNIYTSMAKPSQYPAVLLTSFAICTVMYAAVAVLGYMMFGESTQSQFTLNMPQDLVASKIALWTTVVNPFTKYPFSLCNEFIDPALPHFTSCNRSLKFSVATELRSPSNHFEKRHSWTIEHIRYICINHVSCGNESGGTDTVEPRQIIHVFDPHKNGVGDIYIVRRPQHSLLWSCDGPDWFFTHDASDVDSSVRVLLEHLKGENKRIDVHIGDWSWRSVVRVRIVFSPLQDCPELELILLQCVS
ncbi:UNVERIFIED_CONTAM: Amino acid transporter AVT1C [Sesamum latifolium]|uniref:Amino acid transporter AVT1C n=1 Tax=Sesamum latifolium TaxID=2727402 RepID=A0AAW2XDE3_9LAMI